LCFSDYFAQRTCQSQRHHHHKN